MSCYAVWYCSNPGHKNHEKVGGFITEDDNETPAWRETEQEMRELLKDHQLYIAGLVDIIEV